MLKNYTKENYSSWKEFQQATLEEIKSSFMGHEVNYKGFVLTMDKFTLETVHFNAVPEEVIRVYLGDESELVFLRAVNSGTLNLNKEDMCTYEKINLIVNDAKDVHQQELIEAHKKLEEDIKLARIERAKKEEELAKIKEAREQEKKFQAKIQRKLKELESMRPEKTQRLFNSPTSYYEAIGWMAKHAVSVRAAMPDYMEKWFDSKFDCDFKYVVDSRKRTSGGHPVQWGLSFRMSFNEAVSGILEQRATSQNKKVIDNVAFVWDLIENYGFQFRKDTQDIERIRAEIPKEYISDFEKGLEM